MSQPKNFPEKPAKADQQPAVSKLPDLAALRHSAEHVLTFAMRQLYGDDQVVMAMGPATDDGFYYDFEARAGFAFSTEMIPEVEAQMKKLIKANLQFKQVLVEPAVAQALFAANPYKQEWLQEIAARQEPVSLYLLGKPNQVAADEQILLAEPFNPAQLTKLETFIDLCRGPHVASTAAIKAFKLLKVAGAYWHGDEKNKMLTRVYGTAFASQADLDQYLWQIAEAKKRDHRAIAKKMELFMVDDEVGQGLILWLPKGAFIRHKVMEFAFNTYLDRGYQPVVTPHMASAKLWQHSGHLDFYRDSMYNPFGIEDEEYRLKPMNCPLHIKMYQYRPRSYKELPLRWTEMGTVYRYEKSGTLQGLTRVRGFTQDDAHIVCTPAQMASELVEALDLTFYILRTFGFEDFEVNLSTRGHSDKNKFVGGDQEWQQAEEGLKQALAQAGYQDYHLDEGGAAFYGPKIDIKVADSLGRMWQLSTIQFDFNLPGRFKMKYIGEDGAEHEPLMIHRALLGSLERFMGVYIEHTGGNFPVWLAPIQARILPITADQIEYAQQLAAQLKAAQLRVEVDDSRDRLAAKIRTAEMDRLPYMLVVGAKEAETSQVAVRQRDEKTQRVLPIAELIAEIQDRVAKKK